MDLKRTNFNKKDNIDAVIENGYDLDFGTVFNKSLENYKKIALTAGLVFIIISLLLIAIVIGLFTVLHSTVSMTDFIANSQIENFSSLTILIYIFGVVLVSSLFSPIYAGVIKMADCANQNQEFSLATAFEYYKNSYFKDLFLASAILSFLSVTLTVLGQLLNVNFVGMLFSYMISFFSFLTMPLIIFGDLSAIDAIKASFNIVKKQIIVLLGLLIVSIIGVCLGLIGFCIGIFFTIPFLFSLYYVIYNEIIGVNSTSEIDEIGNDFN